MKMASLLPSLNVSQKNQQMGGKQNLFIDVFSHSGFSTEDGNETTVTQSREGNSACCAFTGWRFHSSPLSLHIQTGKSKTYVVFLQCGNIEGKVRKRRRVLKTQTFIDDEGCIGTNPDGRFWHFNLQLQESQISLSPVQQWRKKSTKVNRTLKLKTTFRPPNKLGKTRSQQNQQPATNRRTRKATRRVQLMPTKEPSRRQSWDFSIRNNRWGIREHLEDFGFMYPNLSLMYLINMSILQVAFLLCFLKVVESDNSGLDFIEHNYLQNNLQNRASIIQHLLNRFGLRPWSTCPFPDNDLLRYYWGWTADHCWGP